jgi:hypothetical protein
MPIPAGKARVRGEPMRDDVELLKIFLKVEKAYSFMKYFL